MGADHGIQCPPSDAVRRSVDSMERSKHSAFSSDSYQESRVSPSLGFDMVGGYSQETICLREAQNPALRAVLF